MPVSRVFIVSAVRYHSDCRQDVVWNGGDKSVLQKFRTQIISSQKINNRLFVFTCNTNIILSSFNGLMNHKPGHYIYRIFSENRQSLSELSACCTESLRRHRLPAMSRAHRGPHTNCLRCRPFVNGELCKLPRSRPLKSMLSKSSMEILLGKQWIRIPVGRISIQLLPNFGVSLAIFSCLVLCARDLSDRSDWNATENWFHSSDNVSYLSRESYPIPPCALDIVKSFNWQFGFNYCFSFELAQCN